MGKTRMQRVKAYKRKQLEKVMKCIIYPPVIATALAVKAIKSRPENKTSNEAPSSKHEGQANTSTYGLGDKELRIMRNIIILSRQYSWEDVDYIERLGSCNPLTGQMDRNSNHYGYKIFYKDGCTKLVVLPKKKIDE